MLDRDVLQDCLLVIGVISHTEITEAISEIYYENLKDLPSDRIEIAFKSIVIDGKFPKIGQIRELATGIVADADWHTIMAVASGTTKSATISGISAIALTTATATNSTLAALKKISFCEDPYTLREIRKDWTRLASMPRIETALPPADATITLVAQTSDRNFEHPADDDFSVRTAAMIGCIREKGAVATAWLPIIDKFPTARKREIMAEVEANNWLTPALKDSLEKMLPTEVRPIDKDPCWGKLLELSIALRADSTNELRLAKVEV